MPPQNALRMMRSAQSQQAYGQYMLPMQQDNAMLAAPPNPAAHDSTAFDQMGSPEEQHFAQWLPWLQQLMRQGR